MTPQEVLAAALVLLEPLGARAAAAPGTALVDVPRTAWVAAARAVRDDPGLALTGFDLLTGVDEPPAGVDVVLRLWSPARRCGLVLRTRCPADDLEVPTLDAVFAGAGWHERGVAEMLGVRFAGAADPRPLLLADDLGLHPLRKDVVLASRAVEAWPGAVEPGQGPAEAALAAARGRRSRRLQPPGVPAPGTWPAGG